MLVLLVVLSTLLLSVAPFRQPRGQLRTMMALHQQDYFDDDDSGHPLQLLCSTGDQVLMHQLSVLCQAAMLKKRKRAQL